MVLGFLFPIQSLALGSFVDLDEFAASMNLALAFPKSGDFATMLIPSSRCRKELPSAPPPHPPITFHSHNTYPTDLPPILKIQKSRLLGKGGFGSTSIPATRKSSRSPQGSTRPAFPTLEKK